MDADEGGRHSEFREVEGRGATKTGHNGGGDPYFTDGMVLIGTCARLPRLRNNKSARNPRAFSTRPRRMLSTSMLYVEIGIVAVLICLNGLLAMSELAVVSSRPARLKAMIDRDVKGAASAFKLGADPGKFLSQRTDRHHAGRRAVRRLLRRHARPAAVAASGRIRRADAYVRLAWRRHRRGAHHLWLADRRRAGAQADRAAQPGGHRCAGGAGDDLLARVAAPLVFLLDISGRARPVAARPEGRIRGEGHRRGDQDAGRRGRASRHHRIGRTADDRRRHAAGRPRGARGDDTANRCRLDQSRLGRDGDPQGADGDISIRACRSAMARSTAWSA